MATWSSGESAWSFEDDDDIFSSKRFEAGHKDSTEKPSRSSLAALVPTKRKSNDLSELTLDKLRFDSLGLHGRDEEISFLFHAFSRLVDKSSTDHHLCLISGHSGTGKTKLAEALNFQYLGVRACS